MFCLAIRMGEHSQVGGQLSARPYSTAPTAPYQGLKTGGSFYTIPKIFANFAARSLAP